MYPLLGKYFSLIQKVIPSKTEGVSVGLDIGTGDCKLVQVQGSLDGCVLKYWAVESIENGDTVGTIRRMFEKLSIPCEVVYTSVFGKGTLIRYINMPKMPLEDLRNSFAIEADKYFPFSKEQIYTDCYILDEEIKGSQMPVMAAATKKELIDARVKLMTELGFHPGFIGINAVALANVVNVLKLNEKKDDDMSIAFLDMGESISNLTIMINNLPWFTRDIFSGGQEFTKRLSNTLEISLDEAEEIKRNPGDKKQEVLNICESAVANMVRELRLSFDYFSTERNQEISTLYLTGGGSMLDGIVEIFEKNLDVCVTQWKPFDALKFSSEIDVELLKQKAPKLGVALGLALYSL
ncbi:hypothetical protein MNBD_UNCLBAC01-161 [hydrothermal vent metagenome]|uniref:Type IV pilus biogenesis protein PilM n=1 Tax=hydrothermal vent metagenome TaxID=652676 RepID=A0A3B1E4V1_9ZZZZ